MYGTNTMFNNQTVPPAYPQIQPLPMQNPVYPQTVRNVIPGRMVKNDKEITPADIPLDRSVALFPKDDGSCIFAKAWTGDGTIQTVKFIPESNPTIPAEEPVTETPMENDATNEKLDLILDILTAPSVSNKNSQNTGKDEKEN